MTKFPKQIEIINTFGATSFLKKVINTSLKYNIPAT